MFRGHFVLQITQDKKVITGELRFDMYYIYKYSKLPAITSCSLYTLTVIFGVGTSLYEPLCPFVGWSVGLKLHFDETIEALVYL